MTIMLHASNENDNDNESENFAFISNGEIIVKGEGIVQVIDMFGRQLYSHQVTSDLRIPTTGIFTPGVYLLRLIQDEKTRTIKIVLE